MRQDRGPENVTLPLASGSRRIHGSVARDLGVAILGGRYAPGDVLPGEIEFSEKLNVSRTAYREAIRILSAKGLVESRPRTGTRVSQRSRWNLLDPDILAWAFESEPSESFIRDLFELRMIVEPAAAALAAERRSGLDIARMGHALEEMGRHGLATEAGRAADQAFHNTILESARNGALMALSSSIAAAVTWTTIFKHRRQGLPRDPMPDHRALYDAIVAGDPAAARETMTELVRLALADTELAMRP
ncbi:MULTISPECIES: FadR/GntR family transcriptional regulator [Methylobacterium]|uniref:DNA-binding transcriptional regulator, FadR family n=1 Tax=Methylobacterium phyllosphaerae TaxID=418223 RepID=A0AAE8HPG4_9HYPH|nr:MULTISPECIES: FadR/GntR family transcriptional regulator [Methylobacterium]APT30273.1 galactonate operon transcriptional repressor [Methylobacterium phyllosphaerae]SFG52247.1 DNA-binding transcriptional regulator, FadR family [Methylobacterium phyllosphaerae]SFU74246.1 DNA-binding transcriptional regulator, FadR family [Methylobacterium sp. UNCCL125]